MSKAKKPGGGKLVEDYGQALQSDYKKSLKEMREFLKNNRKPPVPKVSVADTVDPKPPKK
jgi:hypothetical protein